MITGTATAVQYTLNGVATAYAYPNKIFAATDLAITLFDTATPPNSYPFLPTSGAQFANTLSGLTATVTSIDVDTGAIVTLSSGGTSGWELDIRSNVAETQSTSIKNQGSFAPELHEEAFDRLTREVQDLRRLCYLFGIHGPDTEETNWTTLPPAAARAGLYLGFDANGLPSLTPTLAAGVALSASVITNLTGPQTLAEVAVGIVPVNTGYAELDPRRYGMVGDGITVNTTTWQNWVALVNGYFAATGVNPVSNWPTGQIFIIGFANASITANNFTWNLGSTIRGSAALLTGGQNLIYFNGNGITINGGVIDGNQSTYSVAQGNCLLYFANCIGVTLNDLNIINSPLRGIASFGMTQFIFNNCNFLNNANLGFEGDACAYGELLACDFTSNGNGLNTAFNAVSPAPLSFAAFGATVRFRSHHINLTDCTFTKSGRDGFCVNQGSYAIKFNGCLAWENNDGGFTLANNSTSPGILGDTESPYDIEYNGCEAYNNWGSGLVGYCACCNITVNGGRYYNNNRLAGFITAISSGQCGIYFSVGSSGINIRTKAYDDRQLCPITVVSANVVAATNWGSASGLFTATAAAYPRVALYNASMVFQGYANIVSETPGNVALATTNYQGVTIGSIAPGWFISQRVQHLGAHLDLGSQGQLSIDGFGFLPGYFAFSALKMYGGPSAPGQNILLPECPEDPTELLANPTFDANITNWTVTNNGGSGALNFYTTPGTGVRSPGSGQLVGGSATAGTIADGTLIASGLNYVQGCFVRAQVWVNAVNAGDAQIFLFWTPPSSSSFYAAVSHPGGGWKLLTIGIYSPPGNTQLTLRLASASGKTNYFDNLKLRAVAEPIDNRDFAPNSRCLPV